MCKLYANCINNLVNPYLFQMIVNNLNIEFSLSLFHLYNNNLNLKFSLTHFIKPNDLRFYDWRKRKNYIVISLTLLLYLTMSVVCFGKVVIICAPDQFFTDSYRTNVAQCIKESRSINHISLISYLFVMFQT